MWYLPGTSAIYLLNPEFSASGQCPDAVACAACRVLSDRATILIFSTAKNFRRSRGEAKLGFVQKTVHAQGVGKIPQDRVPFTCLKGAVCSYGPLSFEVRLFKICNLQTSSKLKQSLKIKLKEP